QLLLLMRENNDGNWAKYYNKVIDLWNQKLHSSIGCSPQEAENRTRIPENLETLTPAKIASIKFHSEKIKNGLINAGKRTLRNVMKGKKENTFEINDIVLIKPPARYRKKNEFPYCKKAKLLTCDTSKMNWKVQFLETGGWLKDHIPFSVSNTLINVNSMKKFVLGDDQFLIHHITTRKFVAELNDEKEDNNVENKDESEDEEVELKDEQGLVELNDEKEDNNVENKEKVVESEDEEVELKDEQGLVELNDEDNNVENKEKVVESENKEDELKDEQGLVELKNEQVNEDKNGENKENEV